MNMKKCTTMYGTPLYPPVVGYCAVIRCQGKFMRTSRVIAIHSCTTEEIRFETLNTNYTLRLSPDPQTAAVSNFLTCMAA